MNNMIRKISAKERKSAGSILCPYCKPKKVSAVWRNVGYCDKRYDFACEEHVRKLNDRSDEHLTEADFQTWNSSINESLT